MRLYLHYCALSIRSQLAYRATFIAKTVGHLVVTAIEFLGIWALFARFHTLAGWTLPEVALLYGIADIAFACADGVGRGFDKFGNLLKAGDFDRMLLRPRSPIFQLLAHELVLMRLGRLAQGVVVLVWAGSALAWTPATAALCGYAIACTACLFLGIVVLQASSAFWTTETLEVWSAFTYGGNYAAQYPMAIYRRWFRWIFTAIIPLALCSYYPARVILGRDGWSALALLGPLAGPGFLVASFGVFRIGLRRHASTGS